MIRPTAPLMLTLIAAACASAQTTVVCFGDSTTAPRQGVTVYSQLLAAELSGEGGQYTIVNAGVGGDTTAAAAERFARDVLAHKPKIVVIQFGINDAAIDVWKSPPARSPRVSIQDYEKNLAGFLAQLRRINARPILMTPNPLRWTDNTRRMYGKAPYRPDDPDGFDVMLRQYAQILRKVAQQHRVELVDVHQAFLGAEPDRLLSDGMHPNDAGHRLVADLLKQTIGGGKAQASLPESQRIDPRDAQSPLLLGAAPKGRPVRLPDGSLGSFSTQRIDGRLAMVRSTDGGRTWADAQPTFALPAGATGAGLPVLDRDGELHAVFLTPRGKGKPAVDFFLDLWHVRSFDGRTRWGEPQRIWEGYCGAILDFQALPSGRLVVPFAAWKKPGQDIEPDTGSNYTLVVYSDDRGATWRQSSSKLTSPCAPGYNGNNYGAIEPTILPLRDGRTWMLLRTQTGRLYESFSSDGAEWSRAAPAPFWSSSSPAALVRMNSGRIVVVWNNCQMPPKVDGAGVYGGRDALHAAFSDDEGKTWRGLREIYRDPFRDQTPPRFGDRGTAYPVATAIDEHTLAVATGQGDRRALLLVDDRWLQATEQHDDFSAGLAAWHVWKPHGPAQRFWRDRAPGPALIDHPAKPAAKALHIRRPDARDADGAMWNFPAGSAGRVTMRVMLPRGSAGAAVGLADRFFDPIDPAGERESIFSFRLGVEPTPGAVALGAEQWRTLTIDFSPAGAHAAVDGERRASAPPIAAPLHGVSYLRFRSVAESVDPAGLMIESVHVQVQPQQ